jgi:hypothetical protein
MSIDVEHVHHCKLRLCGFKNCKKRIIRQGRRERESFMANRQTFTLLFVAAITSISLYMVPVWAEKPGKLPMNCTSGEIAKWDGLVWVCDDLPGVDAGPKTVFVTSGVFTGDLQSPGVAPTGLRGGDEICQAAAEQGIVPPGTYIAWLSTPVKDAIDRLPPNPGGYFLPSLIKVADDKADLTDGSIQHAIDEDEFGIIISPVHVWTGTMGDGTSEGSNCLDWTDETAPLTFGSYGVNGRTDAFWTDVDDRFCDSANIHLYCFQR